MSGEEVSCNIQAGIDENLGFREAIVLEKRSKSFTHGGIKVDKLPVSFRRAFYERLTLERGLRFGLGQTMDTQSTRKRAYRGAGIVPLLLEPKV